MSFQTLYLRSAASTNTVKPTGTFASYSGTTGTTPYTGSGALSLAATAGSGVVNRSVTVNPQSSSRTFPHSQYCSPPLAAQTIAAGSWAVGLALSQLQANSSASAGALVSLYVVNGATGAVRATICDKQAVGASRVAATTYVTRYSAVISGAAAMVQDGDYLVAEVGDSYTSTTNTQQSQRFSFEGTTAITADGVTNTNAQSFVAAPSSIYAQGDTVPVGSTFTLSGSGTADAPTGSGTGLAATPPTTTLSGSATSAAPTGSGAGLASMYPTFATLQDDFNGGSLNAAKWAATADSGVTIAQTGGKIAITPTTAAGYAYLNTVDPHTLVDSSVTVELPQIQDAAGSAETHIRLYRNGSSDYVRLLINGNPRTLVLNLRVGGTETSPASVAYNPAAMRWLRLIHASGDNTLRAQYSADRATWTELWSATAPFALGNLNLDLSSGHYNAEAASSVPTQFDNVNTAGTTTYTLSGSATAGAPTGSGAGLTATKPTYTLSGGGTAGAPSGGGAGLAATPPAFALSGAGAAGSAAGSGTGLSATAPQYALSGAGTAQPASGSGAGLTAAPPSYTLSGAAAASAPTGGGVGLTSDSPPATLSGSTTAGDATGTGPGLVAMPPSYALSGVATAAAPTGSGIGLAASPPTYALSGVGLAGAPSGSGAGLIATVPSYTLTGGATPDAATGGGAGLTATGPRATLSGQGIAQSPSGSGAGLASAPPTYTLAGAAAATAATGGGAGLVATPPPTFVLSGGATAGPATGVGNLTGAPPLFALSGAAQAGTPLGGGPGLSATIPTFTLSGSAMALAALGTGPGLHASAPGQSLVGAVGAWSGDDITGAWSGGDGPRGTWDEAQPLRGEWKP